MRIASLLPSIVVLLLALSGQANGQALLADEAALLAVLHPAAKGVELEDEEVTKGRFLVELDTVELDARHLAVLVVTSGLRPGRDAYYDQTLQAEVAVVRGGGKSLSVLAREDVSTPSGAGGHRASVSTPVTGKKGEKLIQVSVGRHSDGEGSGEVLTFFQFLGEEGGLERILEEEYTPSSGSGYPSERGGAKLDTHPSIHEGYSDVSLTIRRESCETDEDCKQERRMERICWTGTRYDKSDDCLVSSVTASSQLKSGKAASPTYDPGNVRDGDGSTAWCEGAKGTGSGEWLEFEFNSPVRVQTLSLVAGYNKSPDVWRKNARLKRVRLHFSDGKRQDADLKDSASPQAIPLESKRALESVKLEVLAVYPGSRHPDLCVSEVDFSGVKAAPVSEK